MCFVRVKTEAAGINALFYCFFLGGRGDRRGENVLLGFCRHQRNKGCSSAEFIYGRGRDQIRQSYIWRRTDESAVINLDYVPNPGSAAKTLTLGP